MNARACNELTKLFFHEPTSDLTLIQLLLVRAGLVAQQVLPEGFWVIQPINAINQNWWLGPFRTRVEMLNYVVFNLVPFILYAPYTGPGKVIGPGSFPGLAAYKDALEE